MIGKFLFPFSIATLPFAFPVLAQAPGGLPHRNGQNIIETSCSACHSLSVVTNSGHTREDWDTVVHQMVNVGAPVPLDQFNAVVDYLAQNFPEKVLSPAVIVPGPVNVTIKEWTVPTPGSRPHDPMYAPDGSVWYSGHMANLLGRFDPATQQFKEFHIQTPGARPSAIQQAVSKMRRSSIVRT